MIDTFITTCVQIKGAGAGMELGAVPPLPPVNLTYLQEGTDPFKIIEQIFNIFWICNTFDIFIKYGNKQK